MIIEGLKLAFLGMSVVFLFLILLLAVVYISANLLKPFTDREIQRISARQAPGLSGAAAVDDKRIMAVISAAIAAHRSRWKNR